MQVSAILGLSFLPGMHRRQQVASDLLHARVWTFGRRVDLRANVAGWRAQAVGHQMPRRRRALVRP